MPITDTFKNKQDNTKTEEIISFYDKIFKDEKRQKT